MGQIPKATKQSTSDRTVHFRVFARAGIASVIGSQTIPKLKTLFGRDVSEDDVSALSSVRRKIRLSAEEEALYSVRLPGGASGPSTEKLAAAEDRDSADVMLDGVERRTLKQFLCGWLTLEGTIADRDWVDPVVEQC